MQTCKFEIWDENLGEMVPCGSPATCKVISPEYSVTIYLCEEHRDFTEDLGVKTTPLPQEAGKAT